VSFFQDQSKKEARDYKTRSSFGRVFVITTNYIAGTAVLGYIGHWIDKKTGHAWRFMILGAFLGIVWATYETFKLAFLLSKEDDRPKDDRPA
jgi:F0F1-type ATP synthase assembly protein I